MSDQSQNFPSLISSCRYINPYHETSVGIFSINSVFQEKQTNK